MYRNLYVKTRWKHKKHVRTEKTRQNTKKGPQMAEKGLLIRPLSLAILKKMTGQAEDRTEFFLCSPPRDPRFFHFFHKDFFRLPLRNEKRDHWAGIKSSPWKRPKTEGFCLFLHFFRPRQIWALFRDLANFWPSGALFFTKNTPELLFSKFSKKTSFPSNFYQNFYKNL